MEFFQATGAIFWIIAVVAFLTIMVSVEYEAFGFTTGAFIVSAAVLIWTTGVNPLTWVRDNQMLLLEIIGVYLVVGIIWGVVKYAFFLKGVQQRLREFRANRDITGPLPEQDRNTFFANERYRIKSLPPKVRDSKKQIIFWMTYWPFSMPWTVINEPVKKFFNYVYHKLAGMLQGMSDRLFKDIS
jgi:hypothetical protein